MLDGSQGHTLYFSLFDRPTFRIILTVRREVLSADLVCQNVNTLIDLSPTLVSSCVLRSRHVTDPQYFHIQRLLYSDADTEK